MITHVVSVVLAGALCFMCGYFAGFVKGEEKECRRWLKAFPDKKLLYSISYIARKYQLAFDCKKESGEKRKILYRLRKECRKVFG